MSCAPALPSDLTLNIGAGGSVGGYYTLQDSLAVSTITVTAGNTLELLGLNVVRSSFTVRSDIKYRRGGKRGRLLYPPGFIGGFHDHRDSWQHAGASWAKCRALQLYRQI